MNKYLLLGWLIATTAVGGDETGGFRFPGGNHESGKEAFQNLNCVQCHLVKGVALEDPKSERRLELSLGSKERFVKRYEDIVKAITNPQHVVSKQYGALLSNGSINGEISPLMPNMIDDMSARQLMDLVAFLDKAYRENLPNYGKPANSGN